MDTKETPKRKQAVKAKSHSGTIRLTKETIKKISFDLAKINKKEMGRKVKVEAYIREAISGMGEDQFEKLRKESLTPGDKTKLFYRLYCKKNGQISFDEFNLLMAKSHQKTLENMHIETESVQEPVEKNGGK